MVHIQFMSLSYVPWFIILLLAIILVVYQINRIKKSIHLLVDKHHTLINNYSFIRLIIKSILFLTALFLLCCALLSPQLTEYNQKKKKKARNLLIALDISLSMNAVDCKPTRLECAKKKIESLVDELASDHIGLILFSGSSFVLCPMTTDYQLFSNMLQMVSTEDISSGTTCLDQPIATGIKSFASVPAGYKQLVLVTDGEDFSGQIESAVQEASSAGINLYALGIGTQQGGPIAIFENNEQVGHLKDEQGNVIITKLNEPMLVELTKKLNGVYIKSTEDDQDIQALANAISMVEQHEFEQETTQGMQLYPYCSFLALLLLLIQWIL